MDSLEVTYSSLREDVAIFLGWGADSTAWGEAKEHILDRILSAALRQFYFPPPLPGDQSKVSHKWSFLRPVWTLATVASQQSYQLPADFVGLAGTITYSSTNTIYLPIRVTGAGQIRQLRSSAVVAASGRPALAAVEPQKSTGAAPQQFALLLYPTPDAVYTLLVPMRISPRALSADSPHPYGGAQHGETIKASCLAVAERELNGAQGVQTGLFFERLAASIGEDADGHIPEVYGYNGNGRRARGRRRDEGYYVTYNGVLWGE